MHLKYVEHKRTEKIRRKNEMFDLIANFMDWKLSSCAPWPRWLLFVHKLEADSWRWPIFSKAICYLNDESNSRNSKLLILIFFSCYFAGIFVATTIVSKCISSTAGEHDIGRSASTVQWSTKTKQQLFAGCYASACILCRINSIRTIVYDDNRTAIHVTCDRKSVYSPNDSTPFLVAVAGRIDKTIDDDDNDNITTKAHNNILVGKWTNNAIS